MSKTIFSDIDGTLVYQVPFDDIDPFKSKALPGVVDKMVSWFKSGHHIVLTKRRVFERRYNSRNGYLEYHSSVSDGIGKVENLNQQ